MSESVGFSEAPGRSASPGQIVARVGVASIGTANAVVPFDAGQAGLVDAIGYGPLAAVTRRALTIGRQHAIACMAAVDMEGTISVVSQTGDGPTVTCTAIEASGDQIAGPWFAFPALKFKVVREGALGVARAEFYYDGVTLNETVDLPPELPASIIGSIDLTGIEPSDADTLTFIVDPDGEGPFTTTFASVTTPQNIVDQIQESMQTAATLLGSADLTSYTPGDIDTKTFLATVEAAGVATEVSVTFASVASLANIVSQIAAATGITATLATGDYVRVTTDATGADVTLTIGNGTANTDLGFTVGQSDTGEEYGTATLAAGRYLKLSGKTVGTTGTLDITTGTANALLGFVDNTSAEGTPSTFEPRGVGVTFTFAAGDYEKNTTYEVATTAPTISTVSFAAAAAALRQSGEPFSILHVVYEPIDGIDLLSWQTALEAFRVECATAEDNPLFFKWVLGGPLAPLGDWNDVDQDVKTTLAGTQEDNKFNTIVHGDIFLNWQEYSGRHRAQLAGPYVERMALYALNVNPGLGANGQLEKCFLVDLQGNRARVESESLVKLQNDGFSVLRDEKKTPYIRKGRTRAPQTSQFSGEHTARMTLEVARISRERAFYYANFTPGLGKGGTLSPNDEASILLSFTQDLREGVVDRGYASSVNVIITGFESNGGGNKLFVKVVAQRLGSVDDTAITVFVTDDVEIVEGIA